MPQKDNSTILGKSRSTDKLFLVDNIINNLLKNNENIKTLKIDWVEINAETIVPQVLLELYDKNAKPEVKSVQKGIDPMESLEV